MENANLEETNDVTDRISSLPDNLLEHILSLLSTKEAVKTCVLSKRWMSTWACVPVLDISIAEFRGGTLEEREARFERFIKCVFENREWSKLEEFKVFWHADCRYSSSGALDRVILHTMEFKPRVFVLSDCKLQLLSFDSSLIFTCASLQKVELYQNLRNCVAIEPSSVNLPCLKSLYLACASMDDDFMDKLFLGCPILEDLFLEYCVLNICRISSSKLRKLVLINCCLLQCLKISTPLLLHLEARGCCRKKMSSGDRQEFVADMHPFVAYPSNIEIVGVPEDMEPLGTFSWENMASLINARIEFPDLKYSDEFLYCTPKLLPCLSNVTSLDLHLCNSQIKFHLDIEDREAINCPVFVNLKTLKLGGWCMHEEFDLVAFFLCSPDLHRPVLHYHKVEPYPWIIMPTILEEFKDFFVEDKLEDILYKREYLEMVQIIKYHTPNVLIERLLKKLHKHVKTIGAIIIE